MKPAAVLTFAIMAKATRRARESKTLDRVLSRSGVGSRTDARRLVAERRVAVNGRVVTDPERWIDPESDRVALDGEPLSPAPRVYLVVHKPKGYLTTYRDPQGRRTVYDLLPPGDRYLFPVGRLDLDTSGLLLMTNDSAFAEALTDPSHGVPKTYLVKASKVLTDEQLDGLRTGVMLKDGSTRPSRVKRLREPGSRASFEITITEGRNRQVRRMVEAQGAKVLKLARVAIGELRIGELPQGAVRSLLADEVRRLVGPRSG